MMGITSKVGVETICGNPTAPITTARKETMMWAFIRYFAKLLVLALRRTLLAAFHHIVGSNLVLIAFGVYNLFLIVLLVSSTKSAAVVAFGPPLMNAVLRIEGKESLLLDYPEWWIPFRIGWLIVSLFIPEII